VPEERPRTPAEITFAEAFLVYVGASDRSDDEKLRAAPLLDYFQEMPLGKIDAAAIAAYSLKRWPKGAASSTVNRLVYTPLIAAMKGVGYALNVQRPKARQGRTEFLTTAQLNALLDAAAPHLRNIILFMICTGCRLGEALRLQWSDVDLQSARATIYQGKTRRSRGVPLIPEAVAMLGNLPHRNGAVFRTDKGDAYTISTRWGGPIKKAWHNACVKAGLYVEVRRIDPSTRRATTVKKHIFTPHHIRHTFGSWLTQRGVNQKTLSELMGHKTLQMTARYSHLHPEHLRAAADLIGQNLGIDVGSTHKPLIRKRG
jgi:integrase